MKVIVTPNKNPVTLQLKFAIPAKSEPETEFQVKEKPEEKDLKKVTLSIKAILQ